MNNKTRISLNKFIDYIPNYDKEKFKLYIYFDTFRQSPIYENQIMIKPSAVVFVRHVGGANIPYYFSDMYEIFPNLKYITVSKSKRRQIVTDPNGPNDSNDDTKCRGPSDLPQPYRLVAELKKQHYNDIEYYPSVILPADKNVFKLVNSKWKETLKRNDELQKALLINEYPEINPEDI